MILTQCYEIMLKVFQHFGTNRYYGAPHSSDILKSGAFPRVKRPGHGFHHPPPSSAEVKEKVELCIYSPSGLSRHVLGDLSLYIYLVLNTALIDNQKKGIIITMFYFRHDICISNELMHNAY